jgi:lipopolysaccharide/colanic/teichoic acid biosynthesis glycosyltransferase
MKIGGQRIPGKTLVLIASETALIGFGLLLATMLRFRDGDLFLQELQGSAVLLRYGLVILICELSLYYYDLYDLQIVSRRSVLFVRLVQALGTACLLLAFLYYWDPDLSLGRGVAAVAAPIIILAVSGWRLLVDASAPFLRRQERILIVGDGLVGCCLAEEILTRPELNIEIVGLLSETGQGFSAETKAAAREMADMAHTSAGPMQYAVHYTALSAAAAAVALTPATAAGVLERPHLPIAVPRGNITLPFPSTLGTAKEVEKFVELERVDRVVLALAERRGGMPINELLRLKFLGMKIEEAHNMYERITGRILVDHLSPSWLILSDGFSQPRLVLGMKRAVDVLMSVVGLIVAAPIMLLLGLAIVIDSGFPVFFWQARVGRNARCFQILKFRSMRNVPVRQEASWTSDRDPRITRVGKFIRKFRLDELPQLVNVLRGEMSLVGPRPEQPTLSAMLEQKIPYYIRRNSLRPGITGWAQVKYGYGGTVEQNKIKLEHDLFYSKHLSMALDLAIIFETVKVLLSGRGGK